MQNDVQYLLAFHDAAMKLSKTLFSRAWSQWESDSYISFDINLFDIKSRKIIFDD